jgi:hypothetical protein
LEIPEVENAIFKVYCQPGMDIGRLHEIYKLPLIKVVGYIIWDKNKSKVEEREKKILDNINVSIG